MADVTFDVEVEGDAAASFTAIAATAEEAGNKAEEAAAKIRSIPSLKIDADIAAAQVKLDALRAELATLGEGNEKIKVDADIALAEAKLAALREQAKSTGRDIDVAGRAAGMGWSLLGLTIASTAGAIMPLVAGIAGVAAVGGLALIGLTGGFGALSSAAQQFRFELTTLQQTTLQDLAKSAQEGFLPALTDGLKAVQPQLEAMQGALKDFGQVAGAGLSFVLQVAVALGPAFTAFGNLAAQAFGALGDPLRQFVTAMQGVMGELDNTGTTQQAMAGLIAVISALLQLLPPLIDATAHLAAALGPSLATAIGIVVDIAKPLLDLIAAYPGPVAAAVDAWVAYKVAMLAAAAAQKFFGESSLVLDATPIGLIIMAIEALIFIIYELATHWDQVVDGIKAGAEAIGSFIVGIGKAIFDFFQAIIDAVIAPFRAIANMGSSIMNAVGNISVPAMADGGVVTRPTLALIGEGTEPEAVMPLSKLGAMGAGGGQGDIHVHVNNAVVGNSAQLTATIRAALKTTAGRGHGFGFA